MFSPGTKKKGASHFKTAMPSSCATGPTRTNRCATRRNQKSQGSTPFLQCRPREAASVIQPPRSAADNLRSTPTAIHPTPRIDSSSISPSPRKCSSALKQLVSIRLDLRYTTAQVCDLRLRFHSTRQEERSKAQHRVLSRRFTRSFLTFFKSSCTARLSDKLIPKKLSIPPRRASTRSSIEPACAS